ncbi:hypothetical protein AAHB37_01445 [Glutamicibacter halophytocola]|uniref:hypothetical protein n=1 Tax=Glutamicibacter halophytocola TaxID=1933880 RepID=UPI00321B60D6
MILREISCCPELLNAIGPETEADHDACRRAGAVGQFLHPPACRQSRGPLAAMLRFFRMKTRDMQLMGVAGFQSMLDHEPLMPCRRMEAAAAAENRLASVETALHPARSSALACRAVWLSWNRPGPNRAGIFYASS